MTERLMDDIMLSRRQETAICGLLNAKEEVMSQANFKKMVHWFGLVLMFFAIGAFFKELFLQNMIIAEKLTINLKKKLKICVLF